MQYGFRYNGIHCSEMLCNYIPTPEERLLLPDVSIVSEDVPSKDGSYYQNTKLKTREFQQKCYFEDIALEDVHAIIKWLDRNTAGELIFDIRPEVIYYVRPTAIIKPVLYSTRFNNHSEHLYSGTFSASFTAYDPYGYMQRISYDSYDDGGAQRYSGIISSEMMPSAPTSYSRGFLLYNPGTERTETIIRFKGTAPSGIKIKNLTNGTSCSITSPSAFRYSTLSFDGTLGYVSAEYGGLVEDAFECHDDGYVVLESYGEILRDVMVMSTAGTNRLTPIGFNADDRQIGKYIYLDRSWQKIVDVLDSGELIILANQARTDTSLVTITGMNEIEIDGSNYSIESLEILYHPKVL